MSDDSTHERCVVVHVAGTTTEAVVIRSLLESAGIASPALSSTDPYPMRQPPKGWHAVEIFVLESQAEEARRIIAASMPSAEQELDNSTDAQE